MQDPIDTPFGDNTSVECDSCGSAGPDLVSVRRVYLRSNGPAADDAEVLADTERWCFPCRTHYPHVEAS
jgi:hypothetical protein